MLDYLFIALLGISPISELRGAIPTGFLMGLNPYLVILISIIANLLVIPLVYFFLTFIHSSLLNWKFYNKTFNKYIENKRGKLEKYIGTKFEFVALMLFVAIPLPITGAYTGTLLAWFFKLKKKETYLALSLGVLIAATIITTLTILGFKLF